MNQCKSNGKIYRFAEPSVNCAYVLDEVDNKEIGL